MWNRNRNGTTTIKWRMQRKILKKHRKIQNSTYTLTLENISKQMKYPINKLHSNSLKNSYLPPKHTKKKKFSRPRKFNNRTFLSMGSWYKLKKERNRQIKSKSKQIRLYMR